MVRRRAPNKTPEEVFAETETEIHRAKIKRNFYLKLGRGRRSLLELPSLSGLHHLRYLHVGGTGISSLKGIEELSNIEFLNASDTNLLDIEPLSRLKNLKRLEISRASLTDIDVIAQLKKLTHLDISFNNIAHLPEAWSAENLESLNVSYNKIKSLKSLSSLTSIYQLYIDGNPVTSLIPLKGMQIKNFSAAHTSIKDLDGLQDSSTIETLNIANTPVSDLSGLGSSKFLKSIMASRSKITDISALSDAPALLNANFDHTSISDISPLSSAKMLERLDIDETRVSDLSPIASLTELASTHNSRRGMTGIWITGCKFKDEKLNELALLRNPERTVKVLDHVRRTQGLAALSSLDGIIPDAIPDLPNQGPGPQFDIGENGLIGFSILDDFDEDGNHLGRIRALAPLLNDSIENLINEISSNEHPSLRELASEYHTLLIPIVRGEPVSKLAVAQLYGLGIRLQNAATAAERMIRQRFVPEFEDTVKEALDSTLSLHGPFILSTSEGLALLDLTERYQKTPESELNFREASVELAEALEIKPNLIDPDAAAFFKESTQDAADAKDNDKSLIYSSSLSKNITIVLAAGAAVSVLPVAGLAIGGVAGGMLGSVSAIIGVEGLKKTRAFSSITSKITEGIDASSETDIKSLSEKTSIIFKPYYEFIIENEETMRKMAGDRGRFRWLHLYLDWIVGKKRDY